MSADTLAVSLPKFHDHGFKRLVRMVIIEGDTTITFPVTPCRRFNTVFTSAVRKAEDQAHLDLMV